MKRHLPLTGRLSEAWGCEGLPCQHGQNKIKEGNGESRDKSEHKADLGTRTRPFLLSAAGMWPDHETPRRDRSWERAHLKEIGVWAALARSPALSYLPLALHGALQAFCSDANPVSLRIHRKGNRLAATPLRLIAPHFISAHSWNHSPLLPPEAPSSLFP